MSRYVPTNCCQQYQYILLLLLSEKILDPQQAGITFLEAETNVFCIQHSHSLRTASQVSYEAEAEDRGLRTVQFAQTSQRKSKALLEGPNLHWL